MNFLRAKVKKFNKIMLITDKMLYVFYNIKFGHTNNLKLSVHCNTGTDTDRLINIYFAKNILIPNIPRDRVRARFSLVWKPKSVVNYHHNFFKHENVTFSTISGIHN